MCAPDPAFGDADSLDPASRPIPPPGAGIRAILSTMIFGDSVRPAETVAPTEWLDHSCRGEWWTVGALVPNQYESLLRVDAPAPTDGNWWTAYRDLFDSVASIGERHTSSPDRAWFAIWDGHGFDRAETPATFGL
jgi:hypothetical protein